MCGFVGVLITDNDSLLDLVLLFMVKRGYEQSFSVTAQMISESSNPVTMKVFLHYEISTCSLEFSNESLL